MQLKMSLSVTLYGKFHKGLPSIDVFTEIKKKSRLSELEFNEECITFTGSANAIERAIGFIAVKDIFLPDFSRVEGDIRVKRIKGFIKDNKVKCFESLFSEGVPSCWGDMPWRFLTPLTTNKHMELMIVRMNKCSDCQLRDSKRFESCFAFSVLKILHENKYTEA